MARPDASVRPASLVMAGLDPAIRRGSAGGGDGRVKPGHDARGRTPGQRIGDDDGFFRGQAFLVMAGLDPAI
jgi:hypothetical protein